MTIKIDLNNKVALITGARNGNGLAISKKLIAAGCTCIGVDVLDFTRESCFDSKKFFGVQGDISKKENLLNITEQIFQIAKPVDIIVHNAGITRPNEFASYTHCDWDDTLAVNLTAPFSLTKELINFALKHEASLPKSIVNITSLGSTLGFPQNPAYQASKGGLLALTRAMAYDLAKFDIRVNAVAPGYIKTNMTRVSWSNDKLREAREKRTMLGRWGEPEDVANAVIFLASELSAYVTGQEISVDGGWSAKGL